MGYNYERVLNFLERYLVIMIVLAVATYFVFIALANGDLSERYQLFIFINTI